METPPMSKIVAPVDMPRYLLPDQKRVGFRNRVLQFVIDFQAKHRRSPHQKEIAYGVGVATVSSVCRALKLLEIEGRIRRCRTQVQVLKEQVA
jgi:hypothetical protein